MYKVILHISLISYREEIKMGNIKKIVSVMMVMMCVFVFVACGKTETLDGKWVLVKKETSDGKTYKVKGDDASEIYEINGDTAKFYYTGAAMGDKTIDLQVEQTGDGQYRFKMTDTLDFSTGVIDGKYLKCTIGDMTFIYKKE